eukprot:5025842-Pleurochrysis_carterae.AAC.1
MSPEQNPLCALLCYGRVRLENNSVCPHTLIHSITTGSQEHKPYRKWHGNLMLSSYTIHASYVFPNCNIAIMLSLGPSWLEHLLSDEISSAWQPST